MHLLHFGKELFIGRILTWCLFLSDIFLPGAVACSGWSAVHHSLHFGNMSTLESLMDNGATMQKDDYGITPLLLAVEMHKWNHAELLIQHSSRSEFVA